MIFSIITVCLNSESTIRRCVESVFSQTYEFIEYIIIDGGSTDKTISIINEYIDKISYFISEPDFGLYDAMNKGIKVANGDYITFLNSDDLYFNKSVIADVFNFSNKFNSSIIFGNLYYINNNSNYKKVRKYNSKFFKPYFLYFGFMPPHPSSFIQLSVYQECGLYNINYKTAADFDLFVRIILKHKKSFIFFNKVLVLMQTGGVSSSGINSVLNSTIEIFNSLKNNGLVANYFFILLRLPIKISYIIYFRYFKGLLDLIFSLRQKT